MVLDPRKRQKKKERRNAKQKTQKKALLREKALGIAVRLERAATAPVLDCCTTDTLWQQGMAQLLVSRQLPGGHVAFGVFLLDIYCLGVKNAFCNVVPRDSYETLRTKLLADGRKVELSPPSARKLVEGAIAYARELGFPPHSDYQKARHIFGLIDPAECSRAFEYGKEGKPYFIAGPHDSSARSRQIVGMLQQRCGEGGFHFVMPVVPGDMDGLRLVSGIRDSEELDYSDEDDWDEEGA